MFLKPVFKLFELTLELFKLCMRYDNFWPVYFFYIIKGPAGKTQPAHMTVFLRTGDAFVQILALPAKIGAAIRITLFYLQDMIHGYRMIKLAVGIMGAAEYVMPLILVNQL